MYSTGRRVLGDQNIHRTIQDGNAGGRKKHRLQYTQTPEPVLKQIGHLKYSANNNVRTIPRPTMTTIIIASSNGRCSVNMPFAYTGVVLVMVD
jgi:hypothetical protein